MPIKKGKIFCSTRHAPSVFRLLRLVEGLVDELECTLQAIPLAEDQSQRWRDIFGSKENVISALEKLTGILLKIIPIESEVMSTIEENKDIEEKNLSEDDLEIIERYLKKIKNIGNEQSIYIAEDINKS